MFIEGFGKFVCEGDSIACEVEGFTVRATIYRDECGDKPDERNDGFWPSADPKAAGYVLPQNYVVEVARAKRVMDAWLNDEWFFCGVAVTVEKNEIQLTHRYGSALWGVECNYPDSDNDYLRVVANELLGEAIETAKRKVAELVE